MSRYSLETRVPGDFRSIFEVSAQTWKCENCGKLCVIICYAGRIFFEKVSTKDLSPFELGIQKAYDKCPEDFQGNVDFINDRIRELEDETISNNTDSRKCVEKGLCPFTIHPRNDTWHILQTVPSIEHKSITNSGVMHDHEGPPDWEESS